MGAYEEELATERAMKDRFMAAHPESPFVAERVPGFAGLRYFPIDARYVVPARLERLATPQEAWLRTNRDGQSEVRYLGDLRFRLGGQSLRLRLYHAGAGIGTSVFVPFRDRTSGDSSYGPGRYLTLDLREDDRYDLDFNRAFNPYCAYTDAYECGFPPAENDLPIPVPAGERVWSEDRNPRTPSGAVQALRPRGASSRPAAAASGRKASTPRRKAPVRAGSRGRARRSG